MDMRYIEFALADRHFYDRMRAEAMPAGAGGVTTYMPEIAFHESAWLSDVANGWRFVHPVGMELPEQGWKIHCSATLDNAQEILDIVSAYCRDNRISFKHLPTAAEMMRSNMKYAHRGLRPPQTGSSPDSGRSCRC